MRSIKLVLVLVVVLACGVVMTASAAATTSFLSSVTGAKLLSEKVEEQVFKTNAGEVKCSEAKVEKGETGTAGTEESKLLLDYHYSSCIAFGIFSIAEISLLDILYLAPFTLHILKLFHLKAFGGCDLLIKPQTLTAVQYATVGKNIKVLPNVTGMTYTEAGCISGNGTASNGTYTGNMEWMIAGGNLSFMP